MVKATPPNTPVASAKNRPRAHSAASSSSVIASSLVSGAHGRKRRRERHISKVQLQQARRYGFAEKARFGRVKYTLGGTVFIYDPAKNLEITSFPSSDSIGATSGSQAVPPTLLSTHAVSSGAVARNEQRRQLLQQDKSKWKSHSVLVVDMSGSMRRDDVRGARCRSDAVFMALARDYIARQLESGTASWQDVVTVILMRDTAQVFLSVEPMSWVLYNKFVELREWQNLRPSGAGCYLPALDKAQEVLEWNTLGSCALALLFFSDGRPSDFYHRDKKPGHLILHDKKPHSRGRSPAFAAKLGNIAARYGKRLSVSCIGMAAPGEDFGTLKDMADEADAYGAEAAFQKLSLDTRSLSTAVSSLATSLATTKMHMTSLQHPGRQKTVRTDFVRERKGEPEDLCPTEEKWHIYHNKSSSNYVQRLWTWDADRDEFVYLMDSRCVFCYRSVSDGSRPASAIESHGGATTPGMQCPDCKACFVCIHCLGKNEHRGTPDCLAFLYDRRTKAMVQKTVPSFAVSMKKAVFGEGSERVVRKFQFLDDNDEFVGKPWVAKESRFIEQEDQGGGGNASGEGHDDEYQNVFLHFHKQFARTQVLAAHFALKINEALDDLEKHFDPSYHRWLRTLPRFRFLEPLVVELVENGKTRKILIEEMLEGRYTKWNNNMGHVLHKQRSAFRKRKNDGGDDHDDDSAPNRSDDDDDGILSAIEEEEDEEDDNDVDMDEFGRERQQQLGLTSQIFSKRQASPLKACHYRNVRAEDFPQAFSHFSYEKSRKKFMVVDLQGVLKENPDGTKEYILTDPAIHRRKEKGVVVSGLGCLGRTNRGEKGMKAFFETHVCTDACSLLGLVQKID